MFAKVVTLAMVAAPAAAHLSLWHPSMYGFDNPLSAYPMGFPSFVPFDQWWFHGNIDQPPADGQFFDLPAGGQAKAEIACNKGITTFGGANNVPENACPMDFNSLHEADASNTKGCSIAIAYKSDVRSVQPEDFVVISVNHACPWKRDVTFDIPAGLPACPEGGCHCMWGWVHGSDRGGDEMYMTGFKCKVSNPGNQQLSAPKAPVRCNGGSCGGAKQPLYFSLVERSNVNNDGGPPSYNDAFGWPNGAQNDIFTGSTQPNQSGNSSSTRPTQTSQQGQQPTQPAQGGGSQDGGNQDNDNQDNDNQDNDNQEPTTSCEEEEPQQTSATPSATRTGGRHDRYNHWHNNNGGNKGWHDNNGHNDWKNNNNDDGNNGWNKGWKRSIVYSRER